MQFNSLKKLKPDEIKFNNEIRNNALALRRSIPLDQKQHFDDCIAKQLLDYIDKHKYNNIAIYWPTEHEINTVPIINELLKNQKIVSLPQVINKHVMVFRTIKSLDFDYEYFKNIKQPTDKHEAVRINEIDLLIVPLLAYDYELWRLGYGLGYYDRFFQINDPEDKIVKIGLAYSAQQFPKIYKHVYDRKLTMIINEKEIIGG